MINNAMRMRIMSREEAMMHNPKEKTYMVRIFSSFEIRIRDSFPLRESGLYIVRRYFFDDIEPGEKEFGFSGIIFDEDLAEDILLDFNESGRKCDALAIHCLLGLNRSPAVGMGLNEVFGLGYNTEILKSRYPDYRGHIYETMLNTGRRLFGKLQE